MAAEKSFLSDVVLDGICKALDEPELKELAFQLNIPQNKCVVLKEELGRYRKCF